MPTAQIADLLQNFRDASSNTSTQGRYFEKFCREWLTLSGEYPEIERVYLWNDWPRRGNIADIGIDLVAETFDGHFYAIQCKFFQEGSEIPKDQIDSFLAASGKTYDGAAFSQLLIMSTAPLGSNAKKTIDGHTPPCCVIRVDQFDDSAFDWEKAIRAFQSERSLADAVKPRKEPRPHQVDAIENVKLGFKSADRGKLIMACGTGKTFTSLRIAEEV
ncbi:MAG: DEAD/DEAH box helicase family protein, partial [Thermoguttaceae bacterium]|nr:DEAD/DEAH box helicase family protein [Thermoguttaceae bacterium]